MLGGIITIGAIAGQMGDNGLDHGSEADAAEIVEWSIVLSGYDGGTVRLTGELPNGYPTETYFDGELLDRDEDGDFSWALGSDNEGEPVPSPVFLQQAMGCAELAADFAFWEEQVGDPANSADLEARTQAFAQSALDFAADEGC